MSTSKDLSEKISASEHNPNTDMGERARGEEDGEHQQAYKASFSRRKIAFTFTDRRGQVVTSRLIKINDVSIEDIDFCGYRRKGGRNEAAFVIYENVAKDCDVYAIITDMGVEWNVRLRSAAAPRIFEWEMKILDLAEGEIEIPEAVGRIPSVDATGAWAEIEMTNTHSDDFRLTTSRREFKGRVSIRNSETRKRDWSDKVKYPVRMR